MNAKETLKKSGIPKTMPQEYSQNQEKAVLKILKKRWQLKGNKQVISKAIHMASAEMYW